MAEQHPAAAVALQLEGVQGVTLLVLRLGQGQVMVRWEVRAGDGQVPGDGKVGGSGRW